MERGVPVYGSYHLWQDDRTPVDLPGSFQFSRAAVYDVPVVMSEPTYLYSNHSSPGHLDLPHSASQWGGVCARGLKTCFLDSINSTSFCLQGRPNQVYLVLM